MMTANGMRELLIGKLKVKMSCIEELDKDQDKKERKRLKSLLKETNTEIETIETILYGSDSDIVSDQERITVETKDGDIIFKGNDLAEALNFINSFNSQ